MREREGGDTNKKAHTPLQYWNCAKDMGAIERHHRTQVSVPESSATPQDKITQDLFYTTHHQVTIQDSEAIMDRATWPVFSPQTQSFICAAQEFLPMLDAISNWEKASACWKCVFFPVAQLFTTETPNVTGYASVQSTTS